MSLFITNQRRHAHTRRSYREIQGASHETPLYARIPDFQGARRTAVALQRRPMV